MKARGLGGLSFEGAILAVVVVVGGKGVVDVALWIRTLV